MMYDKLSLSVIDDLVDVRFHVHSSLPLLAMLPEMIHKTASIGTMYHPKHTVSSPTATAKIRPMIRISINPPVKSEGGKELNLSLHLISRS